MNCLYSIAVVRVIEFWTETICKFAIICLLLLLCRTSLSYGVVLFLWWTRWWSLSTRHQVELEMSSITFWEGTQWACEVNSRLTPLRRGRKGKWRWRGRGDRGWGYEILGYGPSLRLEGWQKWYNIVRFRFIYICLCVFPFMFWLYCWALSDGHCHL